MHNLQSPISRDQFRAESSSIMRAISDRIRINIRISEEILPDGSHTFSPPRLPVDLTRPAKRWMDRRRRKRKQEKRDRDMEYERER